MKISNVLLVDDDDLFLLNMKALLDAEDDLHPIATATNGHEAIEWLRTNTPDLVLLDMQMPNMNGVECIKQIRALHAELPILILTTFEEKEYIIKGLAYGANGYLLKGMALEPLLQNIRDVINRQFVIAAPIAAKLSRYLLEHAYEESNTPATFRFPSDLFTKKEQEIILLLTSRLTIEEMAEQSFITIGTLRNHLANIYFKLNVNTRKDAIQALQAYLINP